MGPRVTPFTDPLARYDAGRLGMRLFLVSLGILFASTILAFIVVRVQLQPVWPRDLPRLPRLLWLSTAILIVSSLTMQAARNASIHGDAPGLRSALGFTVLLALVFLALQAEAWLTWLPPVSQRWEGSDSFRLALAGFYVLTGLHALHVVGGIIPMVVTARHASAAMYERDAAARRRAVHYVTMYWHFLDAVWIALYATLLATQ